MRNIFIFSLLLCLTKVYASASETNYIGRCDIIYDNTGEPRRFVIEPSTLKDSPARDKTVIAQQGHVSRIPGFDTTIFCARYLPAPGLSEIYYQMLSPRANSEEGSNIVGDISLQYYPAENAFVLADIKVNKEDQHRYHATIALETLFSDLRRRDIAKGNPLVRLYADHSNEIAIRLYKNCGFAIDEIDGIGRTTMSVRLNETKFPYYAKHKKAAA